MGGKLVREFGQGVRIIGWPHHKHNKKRQATYWTGHPETLSGTYIQPGF